MSIFEIISAIVLIIACVFIVVVVLLKDTKTQMSQSISGTSSDSFYQKNAGRTKEAMLNKATVAAVIIFFVMAIAVNVINVYWGAGSTSSSSSSSNTASTSTSSDASDSEQTSDSEETSDEESSGDSEGDESNESSENEEAEDSAASDAG